MFVREWSGEMNTSLWTMLPSSGLPWAGPQRLCLYGSYVDILCVGPACKLWLLTPIPTSPDSKETQQEWLLRLSALCPREFNLSLWFFTCSSSPSSFSQFTSASHARWLHPDATESCPNVYCSFVSSHYTPIFKAVCKPDLYLLNTYSPSVSCLSSTAEVKQDGHSDTSLASRSLYSSREWGVI